MQEELDNPDKFKVLWCASRLLLSAEKNYTVTELECLALVFAQNKFCHYLEGAKWSCYTDHAAIVNILGTNSGSPLVQRWKSAVACNDLTVYHVAGIQNVVADALSRIPRLNTTNTSSHITELVNAVTPTDLIPLAELCAAATEAGALSIFQSTTFC